MKKLFYEYIPAWLLLVIFALIVLHAPITVFIGSHWPALAVPIKAWKEVLLTLAILPLSLQVTRLGYWRRIFSDILMRMIAAYAVLHLVLAVWSHTAVPSVLAGLMIDLRYLAYFAAVVVFLQLYPTYKKSFTKVAALGAVIVVGFACFQLLLPVDSLKYLGYGDNTIAPYLTVDSNPNYVRFNSTMRGPNSLGSYAVIVLACLASYAASYRRKLASQTSKLVAVELCAVASIGALWVSYSRSAFIAAVFALAIVVAAHWQVRRHPRAWLYFGIGVVVAATLAFAMRDTGFVQNIVLHNNVATGPEVDSNSGHAVSIADGVARTLSEPLGGGVGSSGSASLLGDAPVIIENQYLFVAHEVGWLGLALFCAIYFVILRRLRQASDDWWAMGVWASGVGLALVGILLPVWADDTVAIIWWGLAAVVLSKGVENGTKTNKKTA